jgi:hypothetical protein
MCGADPCEKPDCTHGEQHRAACEARTVMRWPKHERLSFYGMVRRNRGESAARELLANVSAEWKRQGAIKR